MQFIWPVIIIFFGLKMIMKPKKKEQSSPADEWKEYNYSDPRSDEYVPPAPPLHPDPTKPQEAESADQPQNPDPQRDDRSAQSNSRSAGINLGKSGQSYGSYDYKEYSKAERLAQRAEKIRARIEHKAHRCGHKSREEWWNYNPNAQTRSGFIGDIYMGSDYWELKPLNISHFIGDTVLDLTKAQIPPGETTINISSFIGDVKVFLPNDMETGVRVVSSAFIGDVSVLEQKEGGIFKHMNIETPYFPETEKRIKLHVSTFIGDVRVTKVG
ncbi:cell wall-active antibiotics response protein [Paenibacillus oenotherae]|uniref:Cell wall-active antibiotics response protein n=2 Tax=Paenibacillus oenotherae TaxID=1435645 RepID=A0ABS7D3W9_9BACL|nr:cell wall-active antibiotics response protein [Paenibacillus oenotherae]